MTRGACSFSTGKWGFASVGVMRGAQIPEFTCFLGRWNSRARLAEKKLEIVSLTSDDHLPGIECSLRLRLSTLDPSALVLRFFDLDFLTSYH